TLGSLSAGPEFRCEPPCNMFGEVVGSGACGAGNAFRRQSRTDELPTKKHGLSSGKQFTFRIRFDDIATSAGTQCTSGDIDGIVLIHKEDLRLRSNGANLSSGLD